MSHNVQLDNIKIGNLSVLKAAVKELQKEGAKIELIEGTGLKARSSGFAGGDIPCDVLLKVEDHKWDVGFVRKGSEYVPTMESDFRHQALSADYGAKPLEACQVDYGKQALGLLMTRYAVIMAETNAAIAGHATQRSYDERTKQFELVVG